MDDGASSYLRYINGDDSAFTFLVDMYYDALVFYINTYVNDFVKAEEISEDVFVKLAIKKPRFDNGSSLKTWLFAIGRNKALDSLRFSRRHASVSLDELAEVTADETELETQYINDERKKTLHSAMQRLKPEYRQVLWLVYFESMTLCEVAKVMRKSKSSVEHLQRRAKMSLKDILVKEGFSYEEAF